MTPQDALESAISDWAALDRSMYDVAGIGEHIIRHMREHYGYVIKRAVPPCRGYERDNDASG